ncbi:MAG TPA: hypothetical protein VFX49_07625 [Chloroflexota bacterium]|nr:hypothetical protein [Chloroflexota bacterium]
MVTTGVGTLLHVRLLGGASQLAQIWFDATVLDRYRGAGGRVLRTNTMGRLKLPSWSIDFGIAERGEADALLHISVGEAQTRIPESERAHWAAHAHTPALSPNYVSVQLSHGTCIDDGDLRDW